MNITNSFISKWCQWSRFLSVIQCMKCCQAGTSEIEVTSVYRSSCYTDWISTQTSRYDGLAGYAHYYACSICSREHWFTTWWHVTMRYSTLITSVSVCKPVWKLSTFTEIKMQSCHETLQVCPGRSCLRTFIHWLKYLCAGILLISQPVIS